MSNPSRARGTKAENGAVTVFQRLFPYCERRVPNGRNDRCDLTGVPIPIEVKWNVADISAAVKEAKAAALRMKALAYGAYIHARGKSADEAYSVYPAWFGAILLRCWEDAGKPMYGGPENPGMVASVVEPQDEDTQWEKKPQTHSIRLIRRSPSMLTKKESSG